MMARGDWDLALPWLTGCRTCGRRCVIWTVDRPEDGLCEWPVPLGGQCPRPERCGRRSHGLDGEHHDALLDLLAEADAEAMP